MSWIWIDDDQLSYMIIAGWFNRSSLVWVFDSDTCPVLNKDGNYFGLSTLSCIVKSWLSIFINCVDIWPKLNESSYDVNFSRICVKDRIVKSCSLMCVCDVNNFWVSARHDCESVCSCIFWPRAGSIMEGSSTQRVLSISFTASLDEQLDCYFMAVQSSPVKRDSQKFVSWVNWKSLVEKHVNKSRTTQLGSDMKCSSSFWV